MRPHPLALWIATAAAVGCARPAAPRASARELACPAAPGSGQPNLTVAPDGRVLLTWIEPAGEQRHRLRHAQRVPGGEWSDPRTIAEGQHWFVNWADFPSLALLPDGTMFAHWLVKSAPGGNAYDVKVSVSRDGGASWTAALTPHQDGTQTEHGFVSMVPWSAQEMGLVWLDGRNTASTGTGHAAHGGLQAEMSLMHGTIGANGRVAGERLLDARVCDCCQTDVARAEGATIVVYRDRSEKEVRDMSVIRFSDGRWSEPAALGRDGWEIDGCPVNGPAVAAAGRLVATAWFTAARSQARVNAAFSSDAGATFGAPIGVDDGRPVGRVDVVVRGGHALVSWLEETTEGVELRVRRVEADGTRGDAMIVAGSSAARSSGFPRMVAAGGEVTIAWRDSAEPPRVRTAVLTEPATR